MADFSLFDVPEYYTGLLGQEQTDKLKRQATGTGITNALLALVAQPRNQRYGSALPYIGRALMAGQQAGQEVVSGGLRDYETQQRVAEMQRKQQQQQALQGMIGGITDPNERLFAQLAPEQYVTSKLKPRERKVEKVGNQLVDISAETPTVLFTGEDSSSEPSAVQEYNFARKEGFKGSFQDWKKLNKSEGVTVNYGAPVAGVDAQGNPVFFQPSKAGGAPQIVSGVAPLREEKPATESQAKAGAFASQMRSASEEYSRLEKEGFNPASAGTQAVTSLAGTPLRGLASPQSQQAQQAQKQWAEAYLRFKTGAAATAGEVKNNMETFFPQFGEGAEVVAQKARMREQAEKDVASAGKQPSAIKGQQPQQRSRQDILKQYGL